jgi:hypothetical protein
MHDPRPDVAIATFAIPVELMQFTLIYDGDLPAGNDKRILYGSKVRNQLHGQLADLWDSHVVMRQLAREARAPKDGYFDLAIERKGPLLDYHEDIPPVAEGWVDLCAPIVVEDVGRFRPLVRSSLHLACSIDILFLRHEEPMHLFVQGGDLDNRIKCFFDGLKMPASPKKGETYQGEALTDEPLCCLLEDDKWISDFSVRTGRLLGRGAKTRHAVRITADVTVKVLRVMDQNLPLVGG